MTSQNTPEHSQLEQDTLPIVMTAEPVVMTVSQEVTIDMCRQLGVRLGNLICQGADRQKIDDAYRLHDEALSTYANTQQKQKTGRY